MRFILSLALPLVAVSCATPEALPPGAAPSDAVVRLTRLRARRTWPSEADRRRWQEALDAADRAGAGLAYEPPLPSPGFEPAVATLEQLDALFRMGEAARTPR